MQLAVILLHPGDRSQANNDDDFTALACWTRDQVLRGTQTVLLPGVLRGDSPRPLEQRRTNGGKGTKAVRSLSKRPAFLLAHGLSKMLTFFTGLARGLLTPLEQSPLVHRCTSGRSPLRGHGDIRVSGGIHSDAGGSIVARPTQKCGIQENGAVRVELRYEGIVVVRCAIVQGALDRVLWMGLASGKFAERVHPVTRTLPALSSATPVAQSSRMPPR
jgi:hypothetical protein